MPNIEEAWRYQKAVVWLATGLHDNQGEPLLNDPFEISVRHEDVTNTIVQADGTPTGVVAEFVVDRRIPQNSIIWIGALVDLPTPTVDVDLLKVIRYNEVPDIKGWFRRKTVSVQFHSQTLPTLVAGTGTS